MAERYVNLESALRFRVTCDSCDLDKYFRTERGANLAADVHEIDTPAHSADVSVHDGKALET